jgi:hypothetical protein
MDREEAIRRLNDAQVAWARISEVRDLIHHPALRRVAVRLPNGAEVRVPRPGREGLSGEMPIVPEMGADTGRIRRGFGSAVMANADLGVADLASLLGRGRSSDGRRKECLKRAVKRTPRSQLYVGYGADSGPSRGDTCRRTSRPNATSTTAVRYVCFTSVPADVAGVANG